MKSKQLDDISTLAHIYVEIEYLDYNIAIEKAKEKLLSDRVGAHKSENSISKEFNDSITEN